MERIQFAKCIYILLYLSLQTHLSLSTSSKNNPQPPDPDVKKYEIYMTNHYGYNQDSGTTIEINLGYLTGSKRKPDDVEYSRPGLTISGGLTYALNHLEESRFFGNLTFNGLRVSVKFNVYIAETYGDEEVSLKQVARLWREYNVSVIVGPQESCLHEAKLATSLNIPMISYFCSDEQPSDKKYFTTFSRTRPPDAAISRAVTSLVVAYDWFHSIVIIVSDSDDQRFKRVGKTLSILLKENGILKVQMISYRGPYHHGYGENPFNSIVTQTKFTTRIYIVISEYYEHLGLVLAMKKQSLLQNGEYLILGVSIDDFKDEKWNPTRYFYGLLHDQHEKRNESKNISLDFHSYLGIVASPPKDFRQFADKVNYYMEQQPFIYPNPLANIGKNKRIRIEAAYLYDAVMLYAQVVRSVILEEMNTSNGNEGSQIDVDQHHLTYANSNNYNHTKHDRERRPWNNQTTSTVDLLKRKIFNGVEISMRLRNLGYKSATGHDSEIDENGDARGNFTLLSLKKKNGQYGLYPVGFFVRSTGLPKVFLTDSIDWKRNSPPLSEPKCGFYNEKCESDSSSLLFILISIMILVITGSAIYLSFRHWRLSRDMDTLMWRIDKREIQWQDGQLFPHGRTCARSRSSSSSFGNKGLGAGTGTVGGDTGSQASLIRFSTVYAPLVTYRERLFRAKKIDIDVFDTSMKQQLQMMREIRHENLNVFIGACHYEDGLLLISDYCTRGSIKDILENEAIKLDDMFISSLVGDLLRGLSYLHNSSPFKFHGNLKPTNCLIDSRWVLKLSDFGFLKSEAIMSRDKKHEPTLIVPELVEPSILITESTCSLHHHNTTSKPSSMPTHNYYKANWRNIHQSQRQSTITCTCPYSSPEYPLLISEQVKNAIDGFRHADIYSLGIILWELLRRESLSTYVGIKNEADLRQHIIHYSTTFWSRALNLLSGDIMANNGNSNSNNMLTLPISTTLSPPSPGFIQHQRSSSFYRNHRLNTSNSAITAKSPSPRNNNQYNTRQTNNGTTSGCASASNNFIVSSQIVETLASCLQFDPDLRPDIKSLATKLRPLHKGMRSNIFDIMIGLMEKYANNLEILVDERTKQLSEEKRKTESLLYELIPAAVAEELKEGLHVAAQSYECVQIFFSDIVGFTVMSAESTPLQVVEFLNDLYTCFDSVIDNFDVYKVETIGDAYMVASGLPIPKEGNFHALEMARMALLLLHTVTTFKIHHRPFEILKLRCGIHSGPVCSGVVGHKRPRYCLFGDTVNTASRMESTGLPLRIHCSEAFAVLVQEQFVLEQRGVVDVKGKGDMMTFWLIREKTCTSATSTTTTTTYGPYSSSLSAVSTATMSASTTMISSSSSNP